MNASWRDRLRSAPLWALFIYYAVAFAFFGLVLPSEGARSFGSAALSGLMFAALMTAVTAVWRRRDDAAAGPGGSSHRLVMERAMRTGTPPEDSSLDQALIALVARRRAQLAWWRRKTPWVFGAFAVMSALLALVQWWFLLYAAVFGAFLIWGRRSSAQSAQRLDVLENALRGRIRDEHQMDVVTPESG